MIMVLLLFLSLQLDAPQPQPETVKERKVDYEIGEEVIKGKQIFIINELKIPFPQSINPFAPLTVTKPSSHQIELGEKLIAIIDSLTIPVYSFESPALRIPIPSGILRKHLIIFLPEFEKDVVSWSLIIYNSKGEEVRGIGQNSLPPKAIYWDGKDKDGGYIMPGETYLFTFSVFDFLGNETKIIGEPILIDGIVYEEKDRKIALINGEKIFAQGTANFSSESQTILAEVSNFIKENFRKEVLINIWSKDENMVIEQAKSLQKELERTFLFPPNSLKINPKFHLTEKPKHSTIEIIIR